MATAQAAVTCGASPRPRNRAALHPRFSCQRGLASTEADTNRMPILRDAEYWRARRYFIREPAFEILSERRHVFDRSDFSAACDHIRKCESRPSVKPTSQQRGVFCSMQRFAPKVVNRGFLAREFVKLSRQPIRDIDALGPRALCASANQ